MLSIVCSFSEAKNTVLDNYGCSIRKHIRLCMFTNNGSVPESPFPTQIHLTVRILILHRVHTTVY